MEPYAAHNTRETRMKTIKINSTVGRGIASQNISKTVKAKNEQEAMGLVREWLEAQGYEVVTQWRGA